MGVAAGGGGGATGPAGAGTAPAYAFARAANATGLNPGGTNTVTFGSGTQAGGVTVAGNHIATPPGVYQVTLSLRSESTTPAIWWVDTATDYVPWTGSQVSFPAASASAAVTGSVTFVANVVTAGVFRPRYASGPQADFRDVQLTVVKLADLP